MNEECKNCSDKSAACVPFFAHENVLMHYNRANKRMLIALIVSLTIMAIGFVILGWMFLSSYNSREQGWQNIVQQRLTEVENGVQQQPNP